jgi:threonyl-tRNA synthetase
MAPVQVAVLPVTEEQVPEALALARRFTEAGLRAEVSESDRGTLGARIRLHRLVPYQAVVGARETTSGTVSLRLRNGLSLDPMPTREAVDRIITATASHSLEL